MAVRSGRVWVSREEEESRVAAAAGRAGVTPRGLGQRGAAEGAGPGGAGPVLSRHDVARVALQALAVFGKGVEALQDSGGGGGGGAGGSLRGVGGVEGWGGAGAGVGDSWRGAGGEERLEGTEDVAREGRDAREAAGQGEASRTVGGVAAFQAGKAWRQRREEASLGCEVLSYCMPEASLEQRQCILGWVRARVATRVDWDGKGRSPAGVIGNGGMGIWESATILAACASGPTCPPSEIRRHTFLLTGDYCTRL